MEISKQNVEQIKNNVELKVDEVIEFVNKSNQDEIMGRLMRLTSQIEKGCSKSGLELSIIGYIVDYDEKENK